MELGLSSIAMETAKEAWHKALSGQQTVVIASSFCCGETTIAVMVTFYNVFLYSGVQSIIF